MISEYTKRVNEENQREHDDLVWWQENAKNIDPVWFLPSSAFPFLVDGKRVMGKAPHFEDDE